MIHLALRAPRVGFALLLPVFLGSASRAPGAGLAAPVEPAAPEPSISSRLSTDSPAFVATIPCVSGTCEVRLYAPVAPAPNKPLPRTTSAQQAFGQR